MKLAEDNEARSEVAEQESEDGVDDWTLVRASKPSKA